MFPPWGLGDFRLLGRSTQLGIWAGTGSRISSFPSDSTRFGLRVQELSFGACVVLAFDQNRSEDLYNRAKEQVQKLLSPSPPRFSGVFT